MQEIKVRIVGDYSNEQIISWLKQQSHLGDCSYYSKGYKILYTTQDIPTDYTILINKVNQDTPVQSSSIWGIQQEPFIPGHFKYIIPFKNEFAKNPETYAQCSKVFAFVPELLECDSKFIPSPPYLYWLVDGWKRTLNFQEIKHLHLEKNKEISCIANTDKKAFPGHIQRSEFVNFLKTTQLPIDYFGGEKKHNTIPTKLEALQDYRYSIAIENSSTPFYFTEKITDCFLAGCMPFYYGAENIADFFPKESFVWIDITKPQEAQKIIQSVLKDKLWEKNQDFILEARRRVLEDYNFLQAMGEKIIQHFQTLPPPSHTSNKTNTIIKGYKRSFGISVLRNLQRLIFILLQPFRFFIKENS
ncbi:hypothetical protein BBW65_00455 [Helicobacter enhydrae]|uniref:Fucosyltransferase C-terminal domain-containing protein n=1 Tax=Helicobacter enhydrae TaxID=222136 RepID=A0A1B1U3T0_9HELI|nr:glycosyltransferase family 10 [Helicobacter enhydrae]ANV97382.1 hypothetical protein BBW65_00455 [Helicobacter enhydrae]